MPSIINATTSTGLVSSADNSGSLQLATNNGTTALTIDTSQNVGIGTTTINDRLVVQSSSAEQGITIRGDNLNALKIAMVNPGTSNDGIIGMKINNALRFITNDTERMRITSGGTFVVAKTGQDVSVVGAELRSDGVTVFTANSQNVLYVNRLTNDGDLVQFLQASTVEGTISVSGSTVSYNGGHLSRWSQLPDGSKDDTILKGTVLTNLDDMCVWEKEGVVADNEQLNKMKVSDVEGDTNVAGVFVNWTIDEQYGVDDMNVAMTGDMIIRIADGVVVQKGDLLMSAGDGTAKPQGDDIRRSKTVAKVTSNHVTCTYADGSYCVPCVLMAC